MLECNLCFPLLCLKTVFKKGSFVGGLNQFESSRLTTLGLMKARVSRGYEISASLLDNLTKGLGFIGYRV